MTTTELYDLTPAQVDALELLGRYHARKLESWTRRSTSVEDMQTNFVARVNIRAVTRLCQLRLVARDIAPSWLWSPYVNHDKFQITTEGLLELERRKEAGLERMGLGGTDVRE
jgi:hypothetical protein